MTRHTKIAYEPHPVTMARKAELKSQGFRIVDVRFKPKDAPVAPAPVAAAPLAPPPPAAEPVAKPQLGLPGKDK